MQLTRRIEHVITMQLIRRLAWVTAGFTYLLVSLGVTVRASNAGPSCPDWPLCYGRLFSGHAYGALLEEAHNYLAGIVGILVIVLALCVLIRARQQRHLLIPALLAPALLIVQIIFGGLTVLWKSYSPVIIGHLSLAEAFFALTLTTAIMTTIPAASREPREDTFRFARLTMITSLLIYGLLLSGSYVFNSGASLACPGWPLCGAAPQWAVSLHLSDINLLHRYVAIFVGLILVATLIVAWRRRIFAPRQAWLVLAAALFFVAQAGLGAFVALPNQPVFVAILHLALATAVWGCLISAAALAARQLRAAPVSEPALALETTSGGRMLHNEIAVEKEISPWRRTLASYINLTKPHVTVLLLGTTVAAMAIAYKGLPPLGLVLATLVGGFMAAGSANCINCYIDRDIDQLMGRTQRRALPAGKVEPQQALIFGLVLAVGSFIVLSTFVNLLSAVLSFAAILFYIFVYTLGLKRRSVQNIVIGGAAGAVPVLVGWAAVTNSLSLPAIWLFAIIFYWTPPHFWALSLLIQKDYEKANVPMMPVVMGEGETRKQIFLYSLLLLGVTLVLFAMHTMGYFYLIGAVVLGGILLYMSIRLLRDQSKKWARTIFWYSNCYLAAIFAMMVIDRVIH
ncbi:protoheme IX farnesyltransferase [Ktedonosporobacter rubrisoli]|uniref:Protoheme IX farnesyltransferase n=1 Tax=Ktedonosporobacter rubrisoli TaxID=2509675 RepID=A0A4V0YZX1_KTERU|nr:heme o synthase [Ktedonosporobacter rubrisoli]QBD81201.1 protoheme IX farnesyltransferase [Ktedonosporobacter rubrisoli]